MTDYHIRFFDNDYQIPEVDLAECGLQDTWKIERVPAITLPVQIVTSVPAQECMREYMRMKNGKGEYIISNNQKGLSR